MRELSLFIVIALILSSCGSHCSRTKRYWRTHRCVNQTERQYIFINNQIVMLK